MPLESLGRLNKLKAVALEFHQGRPHLERRHGKELPMCVYEVDATFRESLVKGGLYAHGIVTEE